MSDSALPLTDWSVISLRDARQNDSLRRSVRRLGGRLLALPGFRLEALTHPGVTADLTAALAAPVCLFASPAAVRFAAQMADLAAYAGIALAPGPGTAAALRRAGVRQVRWPRGELRSEGVLALPELNPPPTTVGWIAAPGGRELFGTALAQRGVRVLRAAVYQRVPVLPSSRQLQALATAPAPRAVLVSSGEAFEQIAGALEGLLPVLRDAVVVAASARLAALARQRGFARVIAAESARPQALLHALIAYAKAGAFR